MSREFFTWQTIISTIFPSRNKNSESVQFKLVTFGESLSRVELLRSIEGYNGGGWSPVKTVRWLVTRKNSEERQNSV